MSKISIQVLGGGCAKCETLLANVKKAVADGGIEADVAYITDFAVIGSYGIMRTPALTVDGRVVSQGKVLKPAEVAAYLR